MSESEKPAIVRKMVTVGREKQLDMFAGSSSRISPLRSASPKHRGFVAPDPQDIYLGQISLQQHLDSSGLSAPLVLHTLLHEVDRSVLESAYGVSGRAPYAPRSMLGLIVYGIQQRVNSLRGLERLAREALAR